MAHTYSLESDDPQAARISRVRLELGDEVAGSGVRPDQRNLDDAEIAVWLAAAGGDPLRATASACEALGRIWAGVANLQVGQRKEDLAAVAAAWARRAAELRARLDDEAGVAPGASFATGWRRDDGYQADGGEY